MSRVIQSLPLKLRVEVLKARNLAPADTNGRSDPYCIVSVGHRTINTSVQPNTLDPEWMQSMVFFSEDLAPFALLQENTGSTSGKCSILLFGYLVVDIWDRDVGNPDDFLGRVILPLSSFPLCPANMAEASEEKWYPLSRNSAKGDVRGDVLLKIQLEAIEPNVELANPSINHDLLIITKGLGFQLPVEVNSKIIDFPGATEMVEIAFSKVYVELCAYRSEAMIILTNYRLIILSSGDMKGNRLMSASAMHTYNVNTDISMWIALNNIAFVEHGTGNTVVRRQASGTVENVESYSVTLHCYDCRSINLTFVTETEKGGGQSSGLTVLKKADERPILPKKLVKQVSDFEKQIRKRRKEVKLKKRIKYLKKALSNKPSGIREKQSSVEERRRRSQAFSTGGEEQVFLPPQETVVPVITEGQEEEEEEEEEEGGDEVDFGEDKSFLLSLKHFSVISDQDTDDVLMVPEEEEILLNKPNIQELEAAYQGLALPHPTKLLVVKFITRLDDIVFNIVHKPPAFYFTSAYFSAEGEKETEAQSFLDTNWDVQLLLQNDMTRLMNDNWRKLPQTEYTLCPSYPPIVYVPSEVRDEMIVEVAKFRSKGRIPSLVWMDKNNGSFIMRSAQPLPGLSDKHSDDDESLIKYALATCSCEGGEGLTIFDARSSSAATGNKFMGKGTEDISRYNGCKLTHLDIPNIHAVRESFEGVKQLALSTSSSKWLSTLESTQWLEYISLILKGAFLIARLIKLQYGNALVHCSDGWDRTAQLTSLTQLMIDPYYRTIDGFMTLIAKEWMCYGHKFKDRLGDPLHPNERSPIFLQFLDCVHQIHNQYPRAFQFNLSFLLFIAEQLHTAWFGTFLFNCHHDRCQSQVFTNTLPLEAHFAAVTEAYINPKYKPTKELILPTWTVRRLRLWEEYFLAWDGTSIASQIDVASGGAGLEGLAEIPPQAISDTSETVVWMSDDKTKSCLLCHKKFAILRRKHHCRKCGRIFCDDCSKNHASLPSLGYSEPVRVCNECYKELTSTQNIQQFSEDDYQVIEHKSK